MDHLYRVAEGQHGLVTRAQLRDHGIDRNRVRRWVEAGKLSQLHGDVFSLPGGVSTPHRDLLAKVLETGTDATVSHSTAAWMWGLAGYSRTPAHIVVSRQNRHHEHLDWHVHQFTGLPAHHRRWIDGVPVTSPALTMLHLAQIVSEWRLERAVDNAWNLRLLTGRDLLELDDELAIQGRNGIVALREAGRRRGPNWVPPQSNLESRFMELMESVGRVDFERQVPIDGETWTARVDFLHRPSRTVIEIQSERYHTSLTDTGADATRRHGLEEAGYQVVEVWDNEIFQQPAAVVRRVADAVRAVA
jgi:very-short-patch-repair endonuclease